MKHFVKNQMSIICLLLFLVGGIIVTVTLLKPKKDGKGAKFIKGREEISVSGERYLLINEIETKQSIGSDVSDCLKAEHGDKVASINNGLVTMGVLYEVKGDSERCFLIDESGRIYAKAAYAEEKRQWAANPENFPIHRIIDTDKKSGVFHDVSEESFLALQDNDDSAENVNIDDKQFASEFSNRREIFAFSADGTFFHPVAELFLYNNEVYLTTGYESEIDKSGKVVSAKLTGRKVSEDLQAYYRPFWP